jgi:hypothetical protein
MKYLKKFEKFDGEFLNKDLIVYRCNTTPKSKLATGKLYFATTKQAAKFGRDIFYTIIEKGVKVCDLDNIKIEDNIISNPKKLTAYLKENDYVAAKKTNLDGVDEFILLDTKTKDKFLFKHGWSDNFDYVAGEPCWTYTNVNNRELFWVISPVKNEYDIDSEYEPYKNKYVLFDVTKSELMKTFDTDTDAINWFNANILPK